MAGHIKFFGTTTQAVYDELKASAPGALHAPTSFSFVDGTEILCVQEVCHKHGIGYATYDGDFVTLNNPETRISRAIRIDPETCVLLMTMDEAKDPFIRNRLLLWDQWLQSQKPLEVTNA